MGVHVCGGVMGVVFNQLFKFEFCVVKLNIHLKKQVPTFYTFMPRLMMILH